jgi:signal transduction histidine kinase
VDRLVDAARATGTPVRASIAHPRLAPATDIAAFRIIQQALTNATAHSPGSPIDVVVRHHGSALSITVTNAVGAGTEIRSSDPGHGLTNMRLRALSVGGVFDVVVTQGEWRVSAQLPTVMLEHAATAAKQPTGLS